MAIMLTNNISNINSINWSTRAANLLREKSISSLKELYETKEALWRETKKCGAKTISEFCGVLSQHGYCVEKWVMDSNSLAQERLYTPPKNKAHFAWDEIRREVQNHPNRDEIAEVNILHIAESLRIKWARTRSSEVMGEYLDTPGKEILNRENFGVRKLKTLTLIANHLNTADFARTEKNYDNVFNLIKEGESALAISEIFELANLSPREKTIIKCLGHGRTLEDIGGTFQITKEATRQTKEIARGKIKAISPLFDACRQGLASIEKTWLKTLERDGSPGVIENCVKEKLRYSDHIIVILVHGTAAQWVKQNTIKVGNKTLTECTIKDLKDAKKETKKFLKGQVGPVPLELSVQKTGLTAKKITQACRTTSGVGYVYGGFISPDSMRAPERQALRLHSLSREKGLLVHRRELAHNSGVDDYAMVTVLGARRDLFITSSSDYVFRIPQPWEKRYPNIKPTPATVKTNRRIKANLNNRFKHVAKLLQNKRLWRTKDFIQELKCGRSNFNGWLQISVSAHPLLKRYAPSVWGPAGQWLARKDYKFLLNEGDLVNYIQAKYANADTSPFPLWDYNMERLWCEWAEKKVDHHIFKSLLSISKPEHWKCSEKKRVEWLNKKRGARYYLLTPPRKPIDEYKFDGKDFMLVAASTLQNHGTCWTDINVMIGNAVTNHAPALYLNLLTRMGIINNTDHWQQWAPISNKEYAKKVFHKMCKFWVRKGHKDPSKMERWLTFSPP